MFYTIIYKIFICFSPVALEIWVKKMYIRKLKRKKEEAKYKGNFSSFES
jgi:hypothetical protein